MGEHNFNIDAMTIPPMTLGPMYFGTHVTPAKGRQGAQPTFPRHSNFRSNTVNVS